MHSVWVRLNAVIFFGLTVLAAMALACALSPVWRTPTPTVNSLRVTEVRGLRNHGISDRAVVKFDLDADLSTCFHWNVKQLFVYLTAEYTTKSNVLNQVVIWDKIVRTPEQAVMKYEDEFNKYALVDQFAELRGVDVKLKLSWDVMPVTGTLELQHMGLHEFALPRQYM